ncbi:MAG: ABC transporter permease [Acidobacteria bacterium]|nr:ABC transporter permease [Acidobacteriota bacterium]
MTFEWFVAMRYLRSPYKPAVLRLITVLSVVGVAAGVATLVIALAVNTGFREALRDRLLGVTAHVNLTRAGSEGIRDYEVLAKNLERIEFVHFVTPAIYQTVLISGGGHARGIILKGIDPQRERQSSEALNRLVAGRADFSADADGMEAILLGKLLAQELRAKVDDYVTVTSPQGRLTPFGMIPRTRRLHVAGIFDSGFYDTDANWAFVTLPSAQALSGVGDQVNVLEFRLTNLDQAQQVAATIRSAAGAGFTTSTWMEQNRALFSALRLEKLITAIFIGLITFVAGLNILVVLSMTVTDKARDIAVLMSMGARREQIRKVFVWQGLCAGGIGTVVGLVLGYSFAWVADAYRLIPLDPEIYAIPFVPLHSSVWDAIWIALAALVISGAATLLPARSAAGILPVEILRYE